MNKYLKTGGFRRQRTVSGNNRGIALVTVLLVIAILGILAAVAIESTGSDIINAGNYMSSEQTLNISNSAMNIVLSQLNTNKQTNSGIGLPYPDVYYYTLSTSSSIQHRSNYITLTAANNINSGNSSFSYILSFISNSGKFGFEYSGTYGSIPGYSLDYYFYNGEINMITQNQSASKTARTGMTFNYGPLRKGYNQ